MIKKSVPMISFQIDESYNGLGEERAEYKCPKGATWADWVESSYNTKGYHLRDGFVELGDYAQVRGVHSTDIISEGAVYELVWNGED